MGRRLPECGLHPFEALLHNAELAHIVKHRAAEFGFKLPGGVELDYSVAFKRSRQTSERLVKGVRSLMKKNKIDTYEGWGTFSAPKTLQVTLNDGSTETLNAKNVIIAVGSEVRTLPNTQISKRVRTYLEFILDDTLPRSIIIVGAGAIGTEFAYVMHNYGTEVTMVEYMPHMLPLEDEESLRNSSANTRAWASRCTLTPKSRASLRTPTASQSRSASTDRLRPCAPRWCCRRSAGSRAQATAWR